VLLSVLCGRNEILEAVGTAKIVGYGFVLTSSWKQNNCFVFHLTTFIRSFVKKAKQLRRKKSIVTGGGTEVLNFRWPTDAISFIKQHSKDHNSLLYKALTVCYVCQRDCNVGKRRQVTPGTVVNE